MSTQDSRDEPLGLLGPTLGFHLAQWQKEIAAQITAPLVFGLPRPSPERSAELRERKKRDQERLEVFMERFKALADEFEVSVVGGFDGDVAFNLGLASIDPNEHWYGVSE